MHCPFCGHPHSKVTDSRVAESGIRRRRECQSCELRFTTYERVQAAPLMVSKQDNRREEFNREKLISGIRKACTKRPVASRTVDMMVEDIEAELQHMGTAEVSTTRESVTLEWGCPQNGQCIFWSFFILLLDLY